MIVCLTCDTTITPQQGSLVSCACIDPATAIRVTLNMGGRSIIQVGSLSRWREGDEVLPDALWTSGDVHLYSRGTLVTTLGANAPCPYGPFGEDLLD